MTELKHGIDALLAQIGELKGSITTEEYDAIINRVESISPVGRQPSIPDRVRKHRQKSGRLWIAMSVLCFALLGEILPIADVPLFHVCVFKGVVQADSSVSGVQPACEEGNCHAEGDNGESTQDMFSRIDELYQRELERQVGAYCMKIWVIRSAVNSLFMPFSLSKEQSKSQKYKHKQTKNKPIKRGINHQDADAQENGPKEISIFCPENPQVRIVDLPGGGRWVLLMFLGVVNQCTPFQLVQGERRVHGFESFFP
jgi:hypothetical protein